MVLNVNLLRSAVAKGERKTRGENGWDLGNVNKKKRMRRKEEREGRI